MEYKLVKYSPPHLDSLITLIDHAFGIDNSDKKGMVVWKYFDSYLNNKTVTYLALNETDEVVGHYVSFPVQVVKDDKEYKTTISTDIATRKDHRGKGLISKLSKEVYKEIRDEGYDFSFGYANDAGVKVDKNSKTYGYQVIDKFVRYFRIVLFKNNSPYHLDKVNSFSEDVSKNLQSKHYRIKKDVDYLNWRYIKKPNSEYTVFRIVNDTTFIGYVVLRFVGKKCYVYDIISGTDEKKHMSYILQSIENTALKHKTRLIIYSVLDNEYWQSLFSKFKYIKKSSNANNYYLSIHIHKNTMNKDVLNKDSWLLMNGDIL